MTIVLDAELESRLRAAAERIGTDAETLSRRAIEGVVLNPAQRVLWNGMTVEQWIHESREWAESHRDWPVLTDEAVQRATWYPDRG